MTTATKLSFTYIRNLIISELELLGLPTQEINDLTRFKEDLGVSEWELSHICFMVNLKNDLQFSFKEIEEIQTLGELTYHYYQLINGNEG